MTPLPLESVPRALDETPQAARLQRAAAALALPLPPAASRQLQLYLSLLTRWSAVHNLTSIDGDEASLIGHVFDSLTLVGPMLRHSKGKALRVLDVGTGAGFPAAVLAATQPQWTVTAIDAVRKKMAFVQQAAAEAGLSNLRALHVRAEALRGPQYDVIVSRAFSSIKAFAEKTEHLLANDGVWVAQKGKRPEREIADLPPHLEVFHVEPVKVPELQADRCLVWMQRRPT